MGKHTPGPWVAFYKSKYGEWHVGVPSSVGTMKIGLFPNGIQTEHPEGDANLIAAAPDLLSALKDLLGDRPSVQGGICQFCGRDYIGDMLEGDCPSDDCPSYKARAAIAEAEGV